MYFGSLWLGYKEKFKFRPIALQSTKTCLFQIKNIKFWDRALPPPNSRQMHAAISKLNICLYCCVFVVGIVSETMLSTELGELKKVLQVGWIIQMQSFKPVAVLASKTAGAMLQSSKPLWSSRLSFPTYRSPHQRKQKKTCA